VYLLLHDAYAAVNVNASLALRKVRKRLLKFVAPVLENTFLQLQSKFPPLHTKLLGINSLPPTAPNLQQPDMWSKSMYPLFYPKLAPALDPFGMPINPLNGSKVLGSRLSMEDFMSLRDFCIVLFHQVLIHSCHWESLCRHINVL
jgi:hypothetical protein